VPACTVRLFAASVASLSDPTPRRGFGANRRERALAVGVGTPK